jgi:tRNA pseudouridine13 synthase
MIRSPFPLEQELGMRWYVTDTPGIGGALKRTAEDFVVEEITNVTPGEGPYLLVRLTKRNWELHHAVREIARALGISHRRIAWAGTKDRRALTSQVISMYDIGSDRIPGIHLRDLTLEVLGNAPRALSLGELTGNRFSLRIRECSGSALQERVSQVATAAEAGFPNYFGVQRFGVTRPITHEVGAHLLRGDAREAVLTYVARVFPGEPAPVAAARRAFGETLDAREALRAFPVHLAYERSMLHHLQTAPEDYEGALQMLPPKLRSLFVSAYQSFLFNHALSARLEEGTPLDVPVRGDLLLFADGRLDTVTPASLQAASMQVRRGRAAIAILMPGEGTIHQPLAYAVQERMTGDGIAPGNFRTASGWAGAAFHGAPRAVALRTHIAWKTEGNDVVLEFTLGPGQYATTVCREFMKADPVTLV